MHCVSKKGHRLVHHCSTSSVQRSANSGCWGNFLLVCNMNFPNLLWKRSRHQESNWAVLVVPSRTRLQVFVKSRDWSGRSLATVVEKLDLNILAHYFRKNNFAEQRLLLPSTVYVVQFQCCSSGTSRAWGLSQCLGVGRHGCYEWATLRVYDARTCPHSSRPCGA